MVTMMGLNPRFDGAFLNFIAFVIACAYVGVLIPDLMGLF